MKKELLISVLIIFSLLAASGAMLGAAPVGESSSETPISDTSAIARDVRTVESYVVESAHPYTNNFDYTWTITKAGATQIRVHFTQIDVESNYDFLYVYDYANAQLQKLTGTYSSGGWSSWSYGEVIKVRLDTDYSVTKYGFKIDQIEYEVSGGGGNVLTNGVTATSSLAATGATEMWTIAVGANALSMYSVLTCGSADFDLYGRLGAAPTTSTYDWRGYTSGGEEVTFNTPGAGTWYIMVRSYSGTGSYGLTVTITYGGSDTTPPAVTINSPANGATVSGTSTISFTATDANGISSRAILIDGTQVSTSSSYSWITTGYADGTHTIRCQATDPSGNTGYSQISVTVANGGGGDHVLQNGVTSTSSLSATGATEMWTIEVGADAVSMYSVLTCGSADFDLYGRRGAAPTTSTYDWRGYTSGGEEVTFNTPGAGTWYIMVRSYSGTGSYGLTVTITYGGSDTTPPAVTINSPANGATVSGTSTISFTATDANGISSRAILIDGTQVSTSSSYSWITTGYADGTHTIRCQATDPSGNTGYSQISVTVANGGGGDHVLQNGVTSTSSLSATGATEMWTIEVGADAVSMYSVLTCGSADFDLYGRRGAAPTTSTYDWRGYTSGGEEVTFNTPGAGTWYIMVRSYSGSGSYGLTVTITYGGGGGDGDGIVRKWAVIVGISDYKAISDLSYCDEDATDWYNYLNNVMDYDYIRVLGDTHTSNYPSYYAVANEANVKASLTWLSGADGDDQVAFITSGHGSGTGTGSSYLCMWDSGSGESGQDGNLYDTELDNYVGAWSAGQIFIFIDHCYSGGMIPEIAALSNHAKVYMTTTCTQNGYGYDDPTHQNGAWTYYFLQYGLMNHYGSNPNTLMESCFDYALAAYPYSGGDTPQEYDGNTSVGFKL